MATVIKRGQANIDGVRGSFDVIIYPVAQTGKTEQQWEEEIVKDQSGFDTAWLARNEHRLMDFAFKLLADTLADAEAGAAFIAPLGTVNLSAFQVADFNGAYQNISGASIDLANVKVGELMTKFRRYTDAGQNASANSTPA